MGELAATSPRRDLSAGPVPVWYGDPSIPAAPSRRERVSRQTSEGTDAPTGGEMSHTSGVAACGNVRGVADPSAAGLAGADRGISVCGQLSSRPGGRRAGPAPWCSTGLRCRRPRGRSRSVLRALGGSPGVRHALVVGQLGAADRALDQRGEGLHVGLRARLGARVGGGEHLHVHPADLLVGLDVARASAPRSRRTRPAGSQSAAASSPASM